MAKNTVPEAKDALNRFKMEAALEVGVFFALKFFKTPYLSHFRDSKNMYSGRSNTLKT